MDFKASSTSVIDDLLGVGRFGMELLLALVLVVLDFAAAFSIACLKCISSSLYSSSSSSSDEEDKLTFDLLLSWPEDEARLKVLEKEDKLIICCFFF